MRRGREKRGRALFSLPAFLRADYFEVDQEFDMPPGAKGSDPLWKPRLGEQACSFRLFLLFFYIVPVLSGNIEFFVFAEVVDATGILFSAKEESFS